MDRSPTFILKAALVGCVIAAVAVMYFYGGLSFLPGLVGGFAASLLAFMLALSWESDRERKRGMAAAAELQGQRATEVRRRLEPVRSELAKNAESLAYLDSQFALPFDADVMTFMHPQLLEGAWTASAGRLTELIADYRLTGDLAFTYGRIEELRWRLRYRTESLNRSLDGMTHPLVSQLKDEVADLRGRVEAEIANPNVQPLGSRARAVRQIVLARHTIDQTIDRWRAALCSTTAMA